jgi:hypothetical protein
MAQRLYPYIIERVDPYRAGEDMSAESVTHLRWKVDYMHGWGNIMQRRDGAVFCTCREDGHTFSEPVFIGKLQSVRDEFAARWAAIPSSSPEPAQPAAYTVVPMVALQSPSILFGADTYGPDYDFVEAAAEASAPA